MFWPVVKGVLVAASILMSPHHVTEHAHPHHVTVRHNQVIYDSTTPWAIPHGSNVAVYSDGPYAFGHVSGARSELRIDITGGNPEGSNVLDVEDGGGRVTEVRDWTRDSLRHRAHPIIYTEFSRWQQCRDAISGLPGASRVKWWIADPNGVPHIVAGADATQYSWHHGFDLSLARPGFAP